MPKTFQISLPPEEKRRLVTRIQEDWDGAKTSHRGYNERVRSWMQRWENRVDAPKAGEETLPNHTVPLVQFHVFNKLARDMQAMLGENAEITAKATGPSDQRVTHKIGRYMTSRVFDQMKILNPLCEFEFRRILNGHSVAYRPWWKDEYNTLEGGRIKRACGYEGPGFFPLEPDDLVTPAERGVTSIQNFSFAMRRYPVSIDDLQRGDGKLYQGTSNKDLLKRLIDAARDGSRKDAQSGAVRDEKEKTEGVNYDGYNESRRTIWVWEWCGYWRPLKKRSRDAGLDDLENRLPFESDWCIRYQPDLEEIIGVQDLLEIYPKMRRRRPFVESTLIKDGSYRGKGFGALLESLEDEATSNSRLFTLAGELSVGPFGFYRPGSGFPAKEFKAEPWKFYPSEDPGGVNMVRFQGDLQYPIVKQQDILGMAERLTSQTDQSLGRAIDRPNAPRTATGQLALIEEGNIRAWLDATVLREDVEQIVEDFWHLDCDLAPKSDPGIFFRVTEEQAGGLFDTAKGGAYMTAKEFGGKYDLRLKFAVTVYAREAAAQKVLTFYQLALANPLIASNPAALWEITNRAAKAMGIEDFATIVPKPPAPDISKSPDEEWNEMLQGDDEVHPNPADHDDLHLLQHKKQLEEARKSPNPDEQAIRFLVKHLGETNEAKNKKLLMSALTSDLVKQLQDNNEDTGGLHLGGGMPLGLQDLQGQLGQLFAPPEPAPGKGIGSQAAPDPQEGML